MKTSTWLRWVHFLAGISISFYIVFMPSDGWSSAYDNVMRAVVVFVFWTGFIRWQLPRYRRWRARAKTAA